MEMVSSTLGSPTMTGWKRRASAGLSMLPASIAPSAAPAPTMVCSSSMKRMTCPSLAVTSFSTALRRSSNSPRNLVPATRAPMSSAPMRLSLRPSGTSPSTTRRASPSTMAVLPTPGSPISTGLFLVRRERTWITRRISSSRPITGSSLPLRARSVRSIAYFSRARYCDSGSCEVTRCEPRTAVSACAIRSRVAPEARSASPAPPRFSEASASRMCSVETYSSLSFCASSSAASRTLRVRCARWPPSPPWTCATLRSSSSSRACTRLGSAPMRCRMGATRPSCCASSAASTCSGRISWWSRRRAIGVTNRSGNARLHDPGRCPMLLAALVLLAAAPAPAVTEGDYVLKDFKFASGETLPDLRIHYRTLGKYDGRNAVLVLHGTGGSGAQFLTDGFAGVLFGPGQLLGADKYFLVLPDGIGHGKSSKPSDGLRAKFPRYTYDDMVEAQYRLLREKLGIAHLRLVMGTSMGGMHTWLWGEEHPAFMDALMPLASLPVQIAGRNRVMRKMILDGIRGDPAWKGGDYQTQPREGLVAALDVLLLMGSAPLAWQAQAPSRDAADKLYEEMLQKRLAAADANDMLYAFDASREYDPQPRLEAIEAPLVAVNSADDVINPPELGVLEREIKRVRRGRAVVLQITPQTRGHGTHSLPAVWKRYLAELLQRSGHVAAN